MRYNVTGFIFVLKCLFITMNVTAIVSLFVLLHTHNNLIRNAIRAIAKGTQLRH